MPIFRCRLAAFLSTLSLRRATRLEFCDTAQHTYFYPRSPCGERPLTDDVSTGGKIFLSTLSLRRATMIQKSQLAHCSISIHALLAESDQAQHENAGDMYQFLSTLSLRRATHRTINIQRPAAFLSTLSLRRATYTLRQLQFALRYFYPRSPCGERPFMAFCLFLLF